MVAWVAGFDCCGFGGFGDFGGVWVVSYVVGFGIMLVAACVGYLSVALFAVWGCCFLGFSFLWRVGII